MEALNRRVTRLCAVDERQAADMLDELRLSHVAGPGRAAREAARVVARLSHLASSATDWLGEVEINPLLVLADGVVAVDALVGLKRAGTMTRG